MKTEISTELQTAIALELNKVTELLEIYDKTFATLFVATTYDMTSLVLLRNLITGVCTSIMTEVYAAYAREKIPFNTWIYNKSRLSLSTGIPLDRQQCADLYEWIQNRPGVSVLDANKMHDEKILAARRKVRALVDFINVNLDPSYVYNFSGSKGDVGTFISIKTTSVVGPPAVYVDTLSTPGKDGFYTIGVEQVEPLLAVANIGGIGVIVSNFTNTTIQALGANLLPGITTTGEVNQNEIIAQMAVSVPGSTGHVRIGILTTNLSIPISSLMYGNRDMNAIYHSGLALQNVLAEKESGVAEMVSEWRITRTSKGLIDPYSLDFTNAEHLYLQPSIWWQLNLSLEEYVELHKKYTKLLYAYSIDIGYQGTR